GTGSGPRPPPHSRAKLSGTAAAACQPGLGPVVSAPPTRSSAAVPSTPVGFTAAVGTARLAGATVGSVTGLAGLVTTRFTPVIRDGSAVATSSAPSAGAVV